MKCPVLVVIVLVVVALFVVVHLVEIVVDFGKPIVEQETFAFVVEIMTWLQVG